MWKPAEDNPAFKEPGSKPPPLGIQTKLTKKVLGERRPSELTETVLRYNRRDQYLAHVRELIEEVSEGAECLTSRQIEDLLNREDFSKALFALFVEAEGLQLKQEELFRKMKSWTGVIPGKLKTKEDQNRLELVDLLEAITYVLCHDHPLTEETFHKVLSARGVPSKLITVLSRSSGSRLVEVGELMNFIMGSTINQGSKLSGEAEESLRKVFLEHLGQEKQEMNFEEFKKIIPCKKDFFVKRIFGIFDKDKMGTVSLREFVETIQQFSRDDDNAKIAFLFQVYDTNNDGVLQEDDLYEVLSAMMMENGMEFDETELKHLANVLFRDGCKEGKDHLTLDDFKEQLSRQEGLLTNLGIMINKWLVPAKPEKKKTLLEKLPFHVATRKYWANNLRLWILLIFLANLVIMAQQVYFYRDFATLNGYIPNAFMLVARACGRTLSFNSALILVLVLRTAITSLTRIGFSRILPLEHHIYIHKVTGIIIFFQASIHSIAHLCNFALNVQPNPVKFVLLNYNYNNYYGKDFMQAHQDGDVYSLPPKCVLVTKNDSAASMCPDGSFPEEEELGPASYTEEWLCQACNSSLGAKPWNYHEWLLTSKPNLFGLIPGLANPTGIALMAIMAIIFVCSLPFIRRRGFFEIFYFSHLLYWPYFPLIIFHAPKPWRWIIGPLTVWILDKTLRAVKVYFGSGSSQIKTGMILPSSVTGLVVERPPKFNFNAGDWVFVNIPAVASHEWHPFTISSAPEVDGQFTLHIRSVGEWTRRLHGLIKEEYERQEEARYEEESTITKIRQSIKRKYRGARDLMSVVSEKNAPEEGRFNFVENIIQTEQEFSSKWGQDERGGSSKVKRSESDQQRSLRRPVRYISIQEPKIVEYNTQKSSDGTKDGDFEAVIPGDSKRKDVQPTRLEKPLDIFIDGPFGSPSSNIYRAEHAVLIGTGIGVTPFASILQSIAHRFLDIKHTCPSCNYSWTNKIEGSMFNLRKVDFIWINRDQRSFEWFVNLLSQLEADQQEHGGELGRFLEMHMYVTSALQRNDVKAVALQLALDLLHEKEKKDLVTGLKARTNAGRPNWTKVFTKV